MTNMVVMVETEWKWITFDEHERRCLYIFNNAWNTRPIRLFVFFTPWTTWTRRLRIFIFVRLLTSFVLSTRAGQLKIRLVLFPPCTFPCSFDGSSPEDSEVWWRIEVSHWRRSRKFVRVMKLRLARRFRFCIVFVPYKDASIVKQIGNSRQWLIRRGVFECKPPIRIFHHLQ